MKEKIRTMVDKTIFVTRMMGGETVVSPLGGTFTAGQSGLYALYSDGDGIRVMDFEEDKHDDEEQTT